MYDCYCIKYTISITDDGPGLPQDKIDGLFLNLTNLKDQSKSSQGILGISIAKTLVEEMDGSVAVESV